MIEDAITDLLHLQCVRMWDDHHIACYMCMQVAQLPDGVDHNFVLFNKGRNAKFTTPSPGAASHTCVPYHCVQTCSWQLTHC